MNGHRNVMSELCMNFNVICLQNELECQLKTHEIPNERVLPSLKAYNMILKERLAFLIRFYVVTYMHQFQLNCIASIMLN